MKRADLKNCHICNKGPGVMFYRITTETFILDLRAIHRQSGLEQAMGNAEIAQIMGPDEDLAKCLTTHTAVICQKCMITRELAMLIGE